jgi:hypothetical protein
MDPELLASRLQETAELLGVEVRPSPSESDGAVVRLRGKTVVFVPAGAIAVKRVEILAKALAGLDTRGVSLVTDVREAIDRARHESRDANA